MTAMLTRAANRPRPDDWVEPNLPLLDDALLSIMGLAMTPWTDASVYQPFYNNSYPLAVGMFRGDSGGSIDSKAEGNMTALSINPKVKAIGTYVVAIPSTWQAQFARMKAFHGPNPSEKLFVEIDAESGKGFAGPGNNSATFNAMASTYADYLGSPKRVLGYANKYDFASIWPSRPSWLKLNTADYSADDPGTFAQQCYGGVASNPSPVGAPRSVPPFGAYIDVNIYRGPLANFLSEIGIGATNMPFDASQVASLKAMETRIIAAVNGVPLAKREHEYNVDAQNQDILNDERVTLTSLQAQLATIQTALKISAPPA